MPDEYTCINYYNSIFNRFTYIHINYKDKNKQVNKYLFQSRTYAKRKKIIKTPKHY